MDLISDLEKLAALHRDGALTDEEFSAAKARLLETSSRAAETLADPTPIRQATRSPAANQDEHVERAEHRSDADSELVGLSEHAQPLPGSVWWRRVVAWFASRSGLAQYFLVSCGATVLGFFLGGLVHQALAVVMILGLAGMLLFGVAWLTRRLRRPWKAVLLGIAGLVVGVVIGFLIPFGIIMLYGTSGSRPYGEMAGVAAIGWGVVGGAPVGGIAGCIAGAWWGAKLSRRRDGNID